MASSTPKHEPSTSVKHSAENGDDTYWGMNSITPSTTGDTGAETKASPPNDIDFLKLKKLFHGFELEKKNYYLSMYGGTPPPPPAPKTDTGGFVVPNKAVKKMKLFDYDDTFTMLANTLTSKPIAPMGPFDSFMLRASTTSLTKKTPILFDIDGVLADFTTAFYQLATLVDKTVVPLNANEQATWDYDIPQGTQDHVWDIIKRHRSFWATMGALLCMAEWKALQRLENKHIVYYVTSRPSTVDVMAGTRQWLIDRVSYPTVIHATDKGPVAKALGVQFAIDDKVENCNELHSYGIRTFCRAWKYNATGLHPEIPRGSFSEFLGFVSGKPAPKEDDPF